MDPDLCFVFGVVLSVLAFPAAVSAVADGRRPRAAALLVAAGGGLLGYAIYQRPGAYSFDTAPDVFVQVVARLLN